MHIEAKKKLDPWNFRLKIESYYIRRTQTERDVSDFFVGFDLC